MAYNIKNITIAQKKLNNEEENFEYKPYEPKSKLP